MYVFTQSLRDELDVTQGHLLNDVQRVCFHDIPFRSVAIAKLQKTQSAKIFIKVGGR